MLSHCLCFGEVKRSFSITRSISGADRKLYGEFFFIYLTLVQVHPLLYKEMHLWNASTMGCAHNIPVARLSMSNYKSFTVSFQLSHVCVSPAKSEGRTCEYNGRIYQNGESFRAGCKHQCSCIDGAVGCAPLCNNKLPPASPSCPYPRLVRIPGQCCFSVDCHKGTWHLPPKHQVCVWLKSDNW